MIKQLFSLVENNDGIINITLQKKEDSYTMAIVPQSKPELSISLIGSIEDIEKDLLSITPKYKAVIKSALEQVIELETKVKEATKKKAKKEDKKEVVKEQPTLESTIIEDIPEEELTTEETISAIEEAVEIIKPVAAVKVEETDNDLF